MSRIPSLAEVIGVWDQYWPLIVTGIGVVAAVLVLVLVLTFARSPRKDRWIETGAAVLVLAWTSEGMWEVATDDLGFPLPFATVTFCVAEAMIAASATRATAYRRMHGVPGPAGTLVWVLATTFAVIVALAADSPVEFALRLALPLLAIYMWWTGLVAEWPGDTDEMRAERRRRAEEREATWAVTPRTLAVQIGLMKPGNMTTTEAQREHQVRRMVQLADTAALTEGRRHDRALKQLRRLARTADPDMEVEVAARVERARFAELRMVIEPQSAGRTRADLESELEETARRAVSAEAERDQVMVSIAAMEAQIRDLEHRLTLATAAASSTGNGRPTGGANGGGSKKTGSTTPRRKASDHEADVVGLIRSFISKPQNKDAGRPRIRELISDAGYSAGNDYLDELIRMARLPRAVGEP